MKKCLVTTCLFFCSHFTFSQNSKAENEIRNLEQKEVQAILDKDTITLKKLWDNDYVVNNPENIIVLAKPNIADRPVLQKQRTSFTREVEKIIFNGDVAISMGREMVESKGDNQKSEQTIERRYTNIWMKKDGAWKLIARHANKICR